jgi:hypothetical protein
MDLLTTYTHDSELQVIRAPPLISTIHKSPQQPPSLLQPAVSSPAVPWQRLLTVEALKLYTLRFYLHRLPCGIAYHLTLSLAYNISTRTTRRLHCYSLSVALLRICCLATGTCLQSPCPETVSVYRVIT